MCLLYLHSLYCHLQAKMELERVRKLPVASRDHTQTFLPSLRVTEGEWWWGWGETCWISAKDRQRDRDNGGKGKSFVKSP